MANSKGVSRTVKQWLFRKVNRPEDVKKLMTEYRETGRLRMSLRRKIESRLIHWIMAPGTSEVFRPADGDEAELGSVTWFVTNCKTWDHSPIIESVPMLSQAQMKLLQGGLTGESQAKFIRLSDRFSLSLHDSRIESVKEGFALNAGEQNDSMCFGWDWFLVDASGHATRLQETGELELMFANPAEQINIVKCKFMTDTSLRFSSHEHAMNRSGQPYEPEFRLTIKAGSYIHWPVLVDGVVRITW